MPDTDGTVPPVEPDPISDLEAVAAAKYDLPVEPSDPLPEANEEAPQETTDEGTAPDPGAPPVEEREWAEDWEYDDGLKISREQARSFASFEAYLAENPEVAQGIYRLVSGLPDETMPPATESPAPLPPAGAPTTPPDLDLDDPVQARLWQEIQDTRARLGELSQQQQQAQQFVQSQTEASSTALIDRAKASFIQQHNFTSEDMTEVENVAARLNVLPSLLNAVDPVTGVPRKVDPLQALETAFDLAVWQIPRLRDQQIAEFQAQARQDNKRKKKLTSLGGSSGNVPRQTNEVPNSPQERRAAMIKEVGDMLQGNFVQPEE